MKTTMQQREWMAQQVWRRLPLPLQQKLLPYRALYHLGAQDCWMRDGQPAYSQQALQTVYHQTRDLRVLAYAAGAVAAQQGAHMCLYTPAVAAEAWIWVDTLDEEALDALHCLLHMRGWRGKQKCKQINKARKRLDNEAKPCCPSPLQRQKLDAVAQAVTQFVMCATAPTGHRDQEEGWRYPRKAV